jgi:hypothetical protein
MRVVALLAGQDDLGDWVSCLQLTRLLLWQHCPCCCGSSSNMQASERHHAAAPEAACLLISSLIMASLSTMYVICSQDPCSSRAHSNEQS